MIDGIDYEDVGTKTVKTGTTTVTQTVKVLPTHEPTANKTSSVFGTGPSSKPPLVGSGTGFSTTFASLSALPSLNISNLPRPTPIGTGFRNVNITAILPTASSFPLPPTGTGIYPSNLTASAPLLRSANPFVTVNATISLIPTAGSASTTAPFLPSANTTLSVASTAGIASTTTSPPPALDSSISITGCPNIDGTTYTTINDQEYKIQCYIDYVTPAFLGIQEPSLLACLEMCDTENMGSADLSCYGVVYTPDVNVSEGVTCDLKDQAGLNDQSSMENEYAVSAVLVTGVSTNGTGAS